MYSLNTKLKQGLSLEERKSLSRGDQAKAILLNGTSIFHRIAHISNTHRLVELVPKATQAELLEALQQFAFLIQGVWIIKR